MVPPRHIPSLILATTFTFGGMLPLFAPRRAMREFGLPNHIADSPTAQPVFVVYGSRMTIMGLAIYAFHYQGLYSAIDIVLGSLGYAGLVDAYICWKEGAPGMAAFRSISGAIVASMGFFKLTSGA